MEFFYKIAYTQTKEHKHLKKFTIILSTFYYNILINYWYFKQYICCYQQIIHMNHCDFLIFSRIYKKVLSSLFPYFSWILLFKIKSQIALMITLIYIYKSYLLNQIHYLSSLKQLYTVENNLEKRSSVITENEK